MTLEELYRLLRSSHVQAQGIVDTLQEPLLVLDRALAVTNANPAFYRTFRTERESTLGQAIFELGNGQWDIPELRRLLSDVVPNATAVLGYQVQHTFPHLGERTMRVTARQLAHPDENSTSMLVVFEDVTTRMKADAAKDVLIAETRHRMKNLSGILRAVARQTEAKGRTGEEYRDAFMGRLDAILSAQEFISSRGAEFDLASLIEKTLRPIAGAGAVVEPCREVVLSEYQVLPVSMIFHELATNAVKYGALSAECGSVHIRWDTEQRDGQTFLVLDWQEEGGPAVTAPNQRGFGTELIDYSARAEGGEALFEFADGGLQVQLSLVVQQ
ncbi:sensor histidine kinase [Devosia sp. RR2S18]|uniref:sensor histidine kinase n=1 Tax=Devosia rhizosphaerae TaxID=3049774 RepID=UPI0025400BD0|nr:HWE histidine kinase domain-containing protein [Devosia sp. RR2S18]WIJ26404.1 HWE histidine kinase domain-containing protein [Devosia sp. RR2S18]